MNPHVSAYKFAVRLCASLFVLLWLATVTDEQLERMHGGDA